MLLSSNYIMNLMACVMKTKCTVPTVALLAKISFVASAKNCFIKKKAYEAVLSNQGFGLPL